ncbi:hypothetical protein Gotri_020979 [Gossypium trilobum]|uniref:Uncharacterized protein n=1 Tax=Gossypium trilobum TaxID=34281 RepID=A0A7J9DB08_9ROSI|nr:hypothetical protein [Gossypium trilobum]
MDETLQRLSLHEKENVELVIDRDIEIVDEINYDLYLVDKVLIFKFSFFYFF